MSIFWILQTIFITLFFICQMSFASAVIYFQVFLSNSNYSNIYLVLRNYSASIISLHTIIRFQVFLTNPNNSNIYLISRNHSASVFLFFFCTQLYNFMYYYTILIISGNIYLIHCCTTTRGQKKNLGMMPRIFYSIHPRISELEPSNQMHTQGLFFFFFFFRVLGPYHSAENIVSVCEYPLSGCSSNWTRLWSVW